MVGASSLPFDSAAETYETWETLPYIHDPAFAWLRPISELVVQIDEFVSSREPRNPADGEALLDQARSLLVPSESGTDFQQAYYRALQESDEVVEAHAEWKLTSFHKRPKT